MSFLVAFNGQFTPLVQQVSPQTHREVPPVRSTEISPSATEFKRVLEEKIEGPIGKATQAIKAYQKENKEFEEQRSRLYARDIMSSPVKVISEEATASEARDILQKHGFRHLPVVSLKGLITGLISDREVQGQLDGKVCSEIKVSKVIIAEDKTSIHEIALILLNEKINALPIVNHKRELVGIVTLSDILRFVIGCTPFLGRG